MVEYFKNFSPFGSRQRLPDENILELVEFSLPKEWQKQLIIQGFDSETQGLTDLIKFCEHLETDEEIFHTQGEGIQQNKKQSGERHQSSKSEQRKGSNKTVKPSEEDTNKKPNRKTYLCDLYMELDLI